MKLFFNAKYNIFTPTSPQWCQDDPAHQCLLIGTIAATIAGALIAYLNSQPHHLPVGVGNLGDDHVFTGTIGLWCGVCEMVMLELTMLKRVAWEMRTWTIALWEMATYMRLFLSWKRGSQCPQYTLPLAVGIGKLL